MSHINPLFLDSTKPVGDKVVTNVELLGLTLIDGDSVFFEVSDHYGVVQRFIMQKIETKRSIRYSAEVWLKYQHQIQYRFSVVSEGVERMTSASKETLAGHVISEKWEPCANPVEKVKKDKRPPRRTGAPPEIKKTAGKSLCEPHILNQIKSLFEDMF
ncbi:hypothetical protein [Bdellovibrio svalbardensis]|uniref:Uncharacterized protein n=1 Tax=Bdellovibrio svalbardensis TaxID=2972972 RepID=A0ABT6DJL9_9BACT|nr:hypothetical protein [Bdellovibrio svalbardensis]MDG0817035.1 hypothetical protein [Bdellovibrio svalbardensis]